MSILIKDMEMPKNCGDCKAFVCYRQWAGDVGDCFCGITKNDAEAKKKNADCPLVPIPPHGDLIDADVVFKRLQKQAMSVWGNGNPRYQIVLEVMDAIRFAPTIIQAEEGE